MKPAAPSDGCFLKPVEPTHSASCEQMGDTLDENMLATTGLPAIARTAGVSIDSALVVVAAMLAGIAGPDASIDSPLGPIRLAKLDLLTDAEDLKLQKLMDRLVSPLELMNRRLAANMGRNSPVALELLTSGAYSSTATTKLADQEMREKSLRRHMDTLATTSSPGSSESLRQDLAYNPLPARIEAIRHPRFVIKGADGGNLKFLVEACHLRTALVVQPKLGLARQGSQPAQVTQNLIALMEGVMIAERPASIERGRDSSLPAKAHVVLSLARAEIEALHRSGNDPLNLFLWIKEGDSQKRVPADAASIQTFFDGYQLATSEILALRREGKALMVRFETEEGLNEFEEAFRRYESDILQKWAEAKAWARALPQTLFWALSFLRRSISPSCVADVESLMEASFTTARRLVENHCNQVLVITTAKLLADRHTLAGRMVEAVEEAASPVKFRDLARCSRIQRKEIVTPVVDALIEVGVLVRDDDGIHTLGPVDLAEAVESLDQKFARR